MSPQIEARRFFERSTGAVRGLVTDWVLASAVALALALAPGKGWVAKEASVWVKRG